MWRERDPHRFVVGVNLPWVGYGTDFGSSAWYPQGGLNAEPAALERLERTFADLSRDGITIVRLFLLCDLRSGVQFDPEGLPTNLDDAVFRDVDAMLAAARRHDVRVMPALLDFHLCGPARIANGVQLGGRGRLVVDPAARARLLDRVLGPILERYGNDATVIAWDVMNEPEWCLGRGPIPRRMAVRFDALQRFLDEAVQCVRRFAQQPVTVGCAGTWRLDLVKPLGLDFYQVHWYERFGWKVLDQPLHALGLDDRPAILGEFSGRTAGVADVLQRAQQAGYEGALVWSVLADDEYSAYPPDLAAWARSRGVRS
jgi:hypothetical protein